MAEKKTPPAKEPIEVRYAKEVWDAYKDLDKNNDGELEFREFEGNFPYKKVTRDGKTTFDSAGSKPELFDMIFRAREAALAKGIPNAIPINAPINYNTLLAAASAIKITQASIQEGLEGELDRARLIVTEGVDKSFNEIVKSNPKEFRDPKKTQITHDKILNDMLKDVLTKISASYKAEVKRIDPDNNGISLAEMIINNNGSDVIRFKSPLQLPEQSKTPAEHGGPAKK